MRGLFARVIVEILHLDGRVGRLSICLLPFVVDTNAAQSFLDLLLLPEVLRIVPRHALSNGCARDLVAGHALQLLRREGLVVGKIGTIDPDAHQSVAEVAISPPGHLRKVRKMLNADRTFLLRDLPLLERTERLHEELWIAAGFELVRLRAGGLK